MLETGDSHPAGMTPDEDRAPLAGAGLFGLHSRAEDASLILLPVPWDVTASYGGGARRAPGAILAASHQMDLEDADFGQAWRAGIHLCPEDTGLATKGKELRQLAVCMRDDRSHSRPVDGAVLERVNAGCAAMNNHVENLASSWLARDRLVGVVGGDHSCPLGLLRALGEKYADGFGILQIDAHHDLREAYEGFVYSHASIMANALEGIPAVQKLVALGVRDYSAGERNRAANGGERIRTWYDHEVFRRQAAGECLQAIFDEVIAALPHLVYISFDVDGLDPALCPSTGTPVPGGLSFQAVSVLLASLVASGRRVIGFDLSEVAPHPSGGEWDANVGARILYKLCGAALVSSGVITGTSRAVP